MLKVGLKFLEQCSKYTKACDKEHILQTVPQKIGKIDTCGLKLAQKLEKDVIEIEKVTSKIKPDKKAGTIFNVQTNLQEPIVFNELPAEIVKREVYDLNAFNKDGKEIGRLSFSISDMFGLPNLYIKYFGTAGGYKGIGSEMVRKLCQFSDELGFKGHITLQACTGSIPPGFQFKGVGEKCLTSAAIKYKKMGFNAKSGSKEKRLQEAIASGSSGICRLKTSSGIEYDEDMFGSIAMYLSDDAINKFLGK